jgi:hypothetical protein
MMPEETENPLFDRDSSSMFSIVESSIPNHPSFSINSYMTMNTRSPTPVQNGSLSTIILSENTSEVSATAKPRGIDISRVPATHTPRVVNNTVPQHKSSTNSEVSPTIGPGGTLSITGLVTISRKAVLDGLYASLGSPWNRPITILWWSFFFAWVYTIIPVSNYWIYFYVKNQWWVLLTLIAYIEIQVINIPDMSDSTYIVMYIAGFLVAPLGHILQWKLNLQQSFAFTSLSVLFSLIVVLIVSGFDCFLHPQGLSLNSQHKTHLPQVISDKISLSSNLMGSADDDMLSSGYSPMFLATCLSSFTESSGFEKVRQYSKTLREKEFNSGLEERVLEYNKERNSILQERMSVLVGLGEMECGDSKDKVGPSNMSEMTVGQVCDAHNEVRASTSLFQSRLASMESNTNHVSTTEIELNSMGESIWKFQSESFSNESKDGSMSKLSKSSGSESESDMLKLREEMTTTENPVAVQTPLQRESSSDRSKSSQTLMSVSLGPHSFQRNSLFFRRSMTMKQLNWRYVCGGFLVDIENYSFLPRYWNNNYFELINTLKPHCDRRWVWFWTSFFNIFYSVYYVFLIYFTEYFRSLNTIDPGANTVSNDDITTLPGSGNSTMVRHVVLFCVFILCNTLLRISLKSVGMILDKQKRTSISMFFLAEVMALFFYYTFYRVLFESIHSVFEFTFFQVMHLCSEWILYAGRCTHWYYATTERLTRRFLSTRYLPQPRLSFRSWQVFISLDFGIRCAILVVTGYGMILLLATVQFVPWLHDHNDLKQSTVNFYFTTVLIVIAVILEFGNAWLMIAVFFRQHKLNVIAEVRHCFSLPHFALLAVMIGSNLFINPVFAFTKNVPTLESK